MKLEVLVLLEKAAKIDHNSAVILQRIKKNLPMQGGKPIIIEKE